MSFVLRRLPLLAAAVLWIARLSAADATQTAAPFGSAPVASASQTLVTHDAAQRALQMGFHTLALQLLQQLLSRPDLSPELRNELVLERVTALLDENRASDAEQGLKLFSGAPSPAYRLRVAMIAARTKRFDAVRSELGAFRIEELPELDRPWYHYLQGLAAESANDFSRAQQLYDQAEQIAGSSVQRARFTLAREQAHLALGEATDAQIASLRQTMERSAGRAVGYRAVSDLAIALNLRGDRSGAISVLQTQLQNLPREQRRVNDEWTLLLGMIAGPSEGAGRNALRNLLTGGADRDKQRVALQLLARNASEPGRRAEFQAKLDELIAAPRPHPLLEELLLFRAQLALSDRKEGQPNVTLAEEDITQLLQRFPGSQLKGFAYAVLTNAAWERGQYRNAASLASKAREQPLPRETRARLGLLVAEAYFRAADYGSAADAYRVALEDLPVDVPAGEIIFQQVLSEIRAGHFEQAAKLLDERSRDTRFDVMNRWQSEWNLARSLQAEGSATVAYGRLNQLLDISPESGLIPPELLARMRWLQARLSYELGEYVRTLALTASLLEGVDKLDPALKADISSNTLLLQVQANYAISGDEPSPKATELLRRLRAEYPATDAAVYSYILEADAAARKGSLVEAQDLFTRLAESFPKSQYAPYALYRAAGYAEQRAQSAYYREANNLLDRLVRDYPDSPLVFDARLKQGHILRKLSEFGRAQQVYEELEHNPAFAQHPRQSAAQLALADTHAFQAANDPTHLEAANRIYERLLDLPTAPLALRIEAGYKYGLSLSLHGQTDDAIRVWGLVMGFLKEKKENTDTFGAQGQYWLSRTLLQFAELLVRSGKLDQGREAYDLVLRSGLPGGVLARQGIDHLQTTQAR